MPSFTRPFKIVILLLAHILLLSNASADGYPETNGFSHKPVVVTTIKPLSLMIKRIAGNDFEVRQLLSAGDNPHALALSFRQRQWLEEADLIVWFGPNFERFLQKMLDGTELAPRVIEAGGLPGLQWYDMSKLDLHLWLNPDNVMRIYEALARRLSAIAPLSQPSIYARLQEAKAELAVISTDIEAQLAKLPARDFAVSHDGYGHFVNRFGLNQLAYVSQLPEQQLAVRQLMALRRSTKGAACLITEIDRPADVKLARVLNLRPVAADVLGRSGDVRSILDLYRHITQAFVECLGS